MRSCFTLLCLLVSFLITQAQQLKVYGGAQMTVSPGNPFSISGLTLTPSAAFNLSSSLDLATSVNNSFPSPYVLKVFRFDPAIVPFAGSIRFSYLDGELNVINENNLQLYINNGTSWKNFATAIADPGNNYLQADGISNQLLEEVILAASTALPLTWGQASVSREGAVISIKWSTSQEIDVSHFDIERSIDAIEWRIAISGIPARNSRMLTAYEATDRPGFPGRLFYRIRQTDQDNRSSLSKIVVAPGEHESVQLSVTPNPASSFFLVTTSDITKLSRLDLISRSGQILHSWKGGQYQYQLSPVPAGSYILRIQFTDGSIQTRKLQIN